MSVQQKKLFNQGLNSDDASETNQGFPFILNCRILSTDGNDGSITTVNGNTFIPYSGFIYGGVNTCIGSVEDKIGGMVYGFIYNSTGSHQILQYNETTQQITAVLIDNTAKMGVTTGSILNFQLPYLIQAKVVYLDPNTPLLYWTDNFGSLASAIYNTYKKTNINQAITFTSTGTSDQYTSPFQQSFIWMIKTPPPPPTYTWSGQQQNTLDFDYDNTGGAITTSDTSEHTLVMGNVITDNTGSEYNATTGVWTIGGSSASNQAGAYNILININAQLVSGSVAENLTIKVYNGATVIDTVITSITSSSALTPILITLNNVVFAGGNTIKVTYQAAAGATNPITIPSADASWNAYYQGDQKIVPNDLYKILPRFQTQYIYKDNEQSVLSPFTNYVLPLTQNNGATGEDYNYQQNIITVKIWSGNSDIGKVRLYGQAIGQGQELNTLLYGTSLIVELDKKLLNIPDNTYYYYTFWNNGNYTPLDLTTASALFDYIPFWGQALEYFTNRFALANFSDNVNAIPIDATFSLDCTPDVTAFPAGQTVTVNAQFPNSSYLKSGSIYQYGYVYTFQGGRLGQTSTNAGDSTTQQPNGTYGTQVQIPFLTQSAYNAPTTPFNGNVPSGSGDALMCFVPALTCNTFHTPPADAVSYSIVRSQSLNILNYIQFTSQQVQFFDKNALWGSPLSPPYAGTWFIAVDISNITGRYLTENGSSQLVYEWTKGDRMRFIAQFNSSGGNIYDNVSPRYPYYDLEIINYDDYIPGFAIMNNPNAPNPIHIGTGFNLYEIYTPNRAATNDNFLVYEVGETGTIVNGLHVPDTNGQNLINQVIGTYSALSVSSNTYTFTVPNSAIYNNSTLTQFKIVSATGTIYGSLASVSTGTVVITVNPSTLFGTIANTGTLIQAASQTFTTGDCFRRVCNMPSQIGGGTVNRSYSYIETNEASNMYTSAAYDYGRPNSINNLAKRIIRTADEIWSENLIPESQVNGLSTIYGTSIQNYNSANGSIRKLIYINDRLETYQDLKVFAILVNQQLVESEGGGSPITASTQTVLSPQGQYVTYYLQNFGCQHPESIAQYSFRVYFLDVNNAGIIRRSQEGLVHLPMEAKMRVYFANLCQMILMATTNVKCPAVYDIQHGEYILTVKPFNWGRILAVNNGSQVQRGNTITYTQVLSGYTQVGQFVWLSAASGAWSIYGTVTAINGNVVTVDTTGYVMQGTFDTTNFNVTQAFAGTTISWNEKYNQFSTFYSFNPDYYSGNGVNILSWNTGNLYTHNTNPVQNNFYGVQYISEFDFWANFEPSKVKVLEAQSQETNANQYPNWICSAITTPNGQLTNMMFDQNWIMKENNYYAFVKKDENTPNAVGNPIITGNVMRDRTFLVKMQYLKTTFSKLFAINNYFIASERSGK